MIYGVVIKMYGYRKYPQAVTAADPPVGTQWRLSCVSVARQVPRDPKFTKTTEPVITNAKLQSLLIPVCAY